MAVPWPSPPLKDSALFWMARQSGNTIWKKNIKYCGTTPCLPVASLLWTSCSTNAQILYTACKKLFPIRQANASSG